MGVNTLVLNASFEPLHVISWQRAMQLMFQGKVEVIEESENEIRTVCLTVKVPAVLRLLRYVPLAKKKHYARFSRSNIFVRDKYQCQYCLKKPPRSQLTLDHVVPVVQGGGKSWENIVTSCKACNQKKGGRTPEQANMKLARPPREPKWLPAIPVPLGLGIIPDRWKIYLYIDKPDKS